MCYHKIKISISTTIIIPIMAPKLNIEPKTELSKSSLKKTATENNRRDKAKQSWRKKNWKMYFIQDSVSGFESL